MLDRLHIWQHDDQALAFLAYLAKAAVETGRLGPAWTIFHSAETLDTQIWDKYYEPALFREKAACYYAAGEYDAASLAAAKAYQLSNEHDYYRIRAEYCRSVQALALLRAGNIIEAEKQALAAVRVAPKKPGKHLVFAPRILYTACVVESHAGKMADAAAFCNLGLEIAAASKLETRDLSLGYLSLAEAQLQAGDLVRSREAALKSADLSTKLFGTEHQDMVDALDLLAMISLREGDKAAARARVTEATKIATTLFGAGSPGAGIPARVSQIIETN